MVDPTPSYDGANLANLAAELEIRLTGRSPTRGLRPELAELIPHTRNYVLTASATANSPTPPQPPSAGIAEPP